MKIAIWLLVVVLVVSIEALPSKLGRPKRGFRSGASDRFSHGFGKRNDFTSDPEESNVIDSTVIANEELAELLTSNPRLAYAFVRKYIDKNNDGFVSRAELLGEQL